ncbi:Uncharacterised protein [Vibrio cholerae]|uniref:Uncharacterized protein n=1 Tax=Vibrio cholerae TaxID=666 RepID=A0A655RG55_VIBCL|nr:putative glycyl-tRNA synthetase, alpha subunit [Vibrio cholerae]CSA96361.1 Uncharacterised protein [Vibrio cholerae]CSA99975.1 Uncharacterised protein [Vibrio cholerae]CSB42819.1 Uncharacterised protein [Vibrio cholerae]CSB86987.1 Uncharacterised protein [Vibrio cholerae]
MTQREIGTKVGKNERKRNYCRLIQQDFRYFVREYLGILQCYFLSIQTEESREPDYAKIRHQNLSGYDPRAAGLLGPTRLYYCATSRHGSGCRYFSPDDLLTSIRP